MTTDKLERYRLDLAMLAATATNGGLSRETIAAELRALADRVEREGPFGLLAGAGKGDGWPKVKP
ncbi:MAG: hypothetical protein IT481_08695 [Gammaproteobacteria bacterium]|nr:hypothetical protein [Gammaproteobacteria bacterium]